VPLRQAATIIVLRPDETESGVEVLLLQRSRKVGFFPRAWVFPGGRLDPEDHTLASEGEVPGLAAADHPFAVAAIRECFEESGIWLGHGQPPEGLRDRLLDTRAGIVPSDELIPDLSRLRLWAWWVTPEAERRRYDTRFFISCLTRTQSAHATHDARETVDSRWLSPAHALDAAVRGELFVAPPTWRTLQELAAFPDIHALWTHAHTRPIPRVMPVLEHTEHGVAIRLPGHPAHPEPVHPIHAPFARSIVWRDGRWHDA
jgi:8-oxo-dGTP pyrophosphatase MutT (NUDIX family)